MVLSFILKSQFLVLIHNSLSFYSYFCLVCGGEGRWTLTAFKLVKEALETLDSISRKRPESQREYKVDRLVCVFLNLGVLTSVSW